MRALVKYGNKDGEVEIREYPIPKIGPEDVLLEVKAASICGWDIEMWRHTMANPVSVPVIQGHEFSGIIKEVGERVTEFKKGDRVVSETSAVVCGKCPQCMTGNYHLCGSRKGFGYGVDGAFTDYVKVPGKCLHMIPDSIPFEIAAMTEPVCVTYQSMVVLTRILPGEPVLIIGPGPIGLFCLQMVKACGACPVILAGRSSDAMRFKVAEKIGVDYIINVDTEDALQSIMKITNGKGCHVVADAAGNEKAFKLAVDAVARCGQITKIGWGPKPINFTLDPIISKAARIQGTFSHNWATWESAISMIKNKKINMELMLTKCIKLDQWLETFNEIEESKIVKAVMLFNQ